MITNVGTRNVLVVDTGFKLRDRLEAAGAETITVATFSDAINAIEKFTIDYAILANAKTSVDMTAITAALRKTNAIILYVSATTDDSGGAKQYEMDTFGLDDLSKMTKFH